MNAAAYDYDIVGIADAAAPRRGFFDRLLTALLETQMRRARTVIATHAHLLPDGQEAAGVMPVVVSGGRAQL